MNVTILATLWHRRVWAPLLLTLSCCPAALGQASFTAQLRGEVRDPTGALVPGAQVTLTNDATQAAERKTCLLYTSDAADE